MRDFLVVDREIPGPGQAAVAMLTGTGSYTQNDRAARSVDVILSVLRFEGSCHQYIPRHYHLTGSIRSKFVFAFSMLALSRKLISFVVPFPTANASQSQSPTMMGGLPVGVSPQPGFLFRGVFLPLVVTFPIGQSKST